jgi:hypothetical protein
VTLDGLDAYFASLEDVTPSLDDPFWMNGQPKFLGIRNGKLNAYGNTGSGARIEMFEVEQNVARRTRVMQVEPVIDGGSITVQIGYRNLPTEAIAYTSGSAVNSSTGVAHFQHASRWQRFRFNIDGDFDLAAGFNVNSKAAGRQ